MKRKLVTLWTLILLLLPIEVEAARFSDLNGHWSRPYVTHVTEVGAIRGYTDGRFRPDGTMSRAEFYALANRLSGQKQRFTVTYKDVRPGAWYYEDIARGIKTGYLTPTTGALHPNRPISREEAVGIFAYLYGLEGKRAPAFRDAGSVKPGYRAAVAALTEGGYLAGYGDGRFRPKGSMTRGEVAKVASTLLKSKGRPKPLTILDSRIRFGPRNLYD